MQMQICDNTKKLMALIKNKHKEPIINRLIFIF